MSKSLFLQPRIARARLDIEPRLFILFVMYPMVKATEIDILMVYSLVIRRRRSRRT